MKKRIKQFAFLLWLVLVADVAAHAQLSKLNVLMIVIDDLNDYVSVLKNYPMVQTPNLDKFAKTAVSFTRAYCAAPVCNPSRAAVLSGLAPYHTGVYNNEHRLEDSKTILDATFLPEHFKANGYRTITRGKVFHTAPPKERYHAMWDDDGGKGDYGPYPTENNVPLFIRHPTNFNYQPWLGEESDHPDNVTAEFFIDRLGKKQDQPFFMACGLYKPHNPWTAPKRFFDLYSLDKIELPPVLAGDWDDLPPIAKKWAANPVDFKALKESGKWKEVVRSYLACMSFMDWNLGRILEALERSPYKNNTIVCVFADNGFHLGEKEHFAKYVLWEQSTHVLNMWRVPGVTKPGVVCRRTVNLLDIYPSLLELCGLNQPRQPLDGKSIVPLLKNPNASWPHPSITTYGEGNQAIRTEKFRYIHYSDGEEELYDEEVDPNEWKNLAKQPEQASLLETFRQQLQTHYAEKATASSLNKSTN